MNDNAVQQVHANGTETLTDQTIETDLSAIFGYRVNVLQKQKTLSSTRDGNNFNYVISLYALDQDSFVNQQQFIELTIFPFISIYCYFTLLHGCSF